MPWKAGIWTWTIWCQNLGSVSSCGSDSVFCLSYLDEEAFRPVLVEFLKSGMIYPWVFNINFPVTEKDNNNIYNSVQAISSVQQFQASSWTGLAPFASLPLHHDRTDCCSDYPEPSLGWGGHCILCQLFVSCAFSAKLTLPFLSFPTGYHRPLRKAPLAHSVSELHDDQRPERQPGRELHDDHDRHAVFREKEYRRTLLLLSRYLSSECLC